MNENEKLEQDARIALMERYSSKATNQTILLLTVLLIFLTYAQLVSNTGILRYNLLFGGLGVAIYLFIRQMGRLVYWAQLDEAILFVSPLKDSEADICMKSLVKRLELSEIARALVDPVELSLDFKATYLTKLSLASGLYFTRKYRLKMWWVRFSYFSGHIRWLIIAFAGTLVMEVLVGVLVLVRVLV
ncbi:MAG: hypothetical protein ABSB28_06685 [Candidatus Bathyarchaeia archaeon]